MTVQAALDSDTNDLIKSDKGIERVNEGRYIVQAVRSKLQTGLGEWLLDPSRGWLARGDFSHSYDAFDIEVRARSIILDVVGVNEVLSISSFYEDRVIILNFTADTDFGEINLTVPWGGI